MRNRQDELYSNKSNQMIQNYAWALKEKQLKIMELLCSCYMTNYYNEEENTVTVGLSDFMRELGSTTKGVNAKEYQLFRDTLKKLSDYSIIGIGFNGRERLIRIINTFEYIPETNQIKCFMSQDYRESMKLQPKGNTRIEFRTICSMESRYSIKLYNLLRSWQGKGEVYFDLVYLKELLSVTAKSYDNFAKFRQAVLDVAIKEINQKTSMEVTYKGLPAQGSKGTKITRVIFTIKSAKSNQVSSAETPNEGAASLPEILPEATGEYNLNAQTEFDLDLLEAIPEEVHKGEMERVRAVLDVASRYIVPRDFMDFCEPDELDTAISRMEKVSKATQAAEADRNERILVAINTYVTRDYNIRKKNIQNPNAHYKYFLVGFEGWLLSNQY